MVVWEGQFRRVSPNRVQVIFTWSEWKELGQRRIYVWTELRKACPLDLSPSNSVGNEGGGGRPARMVGTSVGTFLCSDMIFSSHLNPIISLFNCPLVRER